MKFHLVTLFPELFQSFLETALLGKAVKQGLIEVDFIDPRDFTTDKHRTVDDTPYGGGDGMVLKPEPFVAAIESVGGGPQRVMLSPQGVPLSQRHLRRFAERDEVLLVCGRYEGFDERIRAAVDEEISLGDFVLNGGEVAAMALMDGVGRLVEGVIGNAASLESESHAEALLEYPQYTRPALFRDQPVPEVLLSGDHGRIARWRRQQMLSRTRRKRPDLWQRYVPSAEDQVLLNASGASDESQQETSASKAYVALMHHPVYDREGRVVTTAITNLDIHDIARSSRTYGLGGYFIVTPLSSQRDLAQRILGHWRDGHGARQHAERREALALIDVAEDLAQVIQQIETREGRRPRVIATSARPAPHKQLHFDEMRNLLDKGEPVLLLFGTGWGLTREILADVDGILAPIRGPTDYNHLSVRSAAAIILDRCFAMSD
ncbi:MAG: tRNA (guanosine(37)-N1)-methyltransferase TrmD [Deltaproteobacteria bacterium]|nr:tRNA (guanosine(37)-N1)-methyltransferase TrmD [Deltaproteobacteria bacterium]